MRPYIICHMLSSVDGKIDGAALDAVTGDGEYEATGAKLNGDAWICGRTTMQQHFAEDEPFVSGSNTPGRTSARLCRSTSKILCHLR
jgi:2,5-diamino-6-(ribosylamino)-4(3H)-pyrimidinone 5'-phosphate reductase